MVFRDVVMLFLSIFTLFSAALAQTTDLPSSKGGDTYYSDCSSFTFRDIDSALLTREEQLALMEQDLFDNLNRSEACLNDANQTAAQRLGAAGGGAGEGGGSGANAGAGNGERAEVAAAQQTAANEPTDMQSSQPPSETSKKHVSGQRASGSSAVCDAVQQGLSAATTDAEKEHFQRLSKDYGCAI
jgi:hypothetical protein